MKQHYFIQQPKRGDGIAYSSSGPCPEVDTAIILAIPEELHPDLGLFLHQHHPLSSSKTHQFPHVAEEEEPDDGEGDARDPPLSAAPHRPGRGHGHAVPHRCGGGAVRRSRGSGLTRIETAAKSKGTPF